MKIVQVDEKQIYGISIRTSNTREMNPETSRIGALHQQFDARVPVNYKNGARVYALYYNYESDHAGAFSVLAGSDQIDKAIAAQLETVLIPSGSYMVFEAKGEMPKVVIKTWAKIWEYFSRADTQYQRSYTTDFEFYKSQTEIEIYIGVK